MSAAQASLISPTSPGEGLLAEDKVSNEEIRASEQPEGKKNEITHAFPSKFSSVAPPTCICRAPASEEDSQPADTNGVLLSIYMNQLCPWFPLIIIPPGTTSSHLQQTRPFLLKAIQLVASLRNIRSTWGQRRVIIQYLSEAVFIRSERSLDLLQGVLVLLGLYHYHCLVHIQFNNLMQLPVSIVGDMDLNIDPVRQKRVRALGGECEELRERNNDERRAIVGVRYMSSNVALTFNKGQIVDCNNRDQLPDELPGIEVISTSSYHEASQNELSRLKTRLPSSLQKNHLILNHLNTAHLRLYEPLLQDTSLLDSVSRSLNTLTLSDHITHARLGACPSAIQTWFEHWLTIPVCFYFCMSQPLAAQLIYSMMMLSRWALLFSDHSHEIVNEQRIDVLHFLNATATRFEAAKSEMSAAQGGVWKNGIWDVAAKKLRMKTIRIEKWWGEVEKAGGEGMFRFIEDDPGVSDGVADDGFGTEYCGNEIAAGFEESFGFGAVGGGEWLWAGDLFDGVDVSQGVLFDGPPRYLDFTAEVEII
ncbi:uncharacterized protein RAG0_07144 [Rhynchosporium agropyri]|uniref:Transcription factor domain-containing protein n=1 Tax=Rhynchosporium agropyri TaxID=914238 RepID=A0A1E1KNA0_9HELO|nr:uncharacterized protein RAG0_07144 [Rhynchosporium agropyri]